MQHGKEEETCRKQSPTESSPGEKVGNRESRDDLTNGLVPLGEHLRPKG